MHTTKETNMQSFIGTFNLGSRLSYYGLWNKQYGLGARPAGTYAVQHIETGVAYVGSTSDLFDRWAKHVWHLNRGNHSCQPLQELFNDDGIDAFVFKILTTSEKTDPVTLTAMEVTDGMRYGIDNLLNYRLGGYWLGGVIPQECKGRPYGYQ
jgi:hypothetical protein